MSRITLSVRQLERQAACKREVELVWNGRSGKVTNVVLFVQFIEQVGELRDEIETQGGLQQDLFTI